MLSKPICVVSLTMLLMSTVRTVTLITAASLASSQSASPPSFEPHLVSVTLRIIERTPNRLKFHLQVKNGGDYSVLVVCDPVRIDGSKGMYLSLGSDDSSLLQVSSEVFPPPDYDIVAPKHRVTYKLLAPGASYEDDALLQAPLSETEPPWREMLTPREVDLTRIQYVELRIGVLPDEPGVRQAFSTERSPTGLEIVKSGPLKGKPLFQIQSILSSSKVKV